MQPTQTGIATAVALVVVIFFFILGGTSWFQPAPTDQTPITNEIASSTTATMPPANNNNRITQLVAKDDVMGTGAVASAGDTITVTYVGALTNGTVFDASANHPETASGFTFKLGAGQVIPGWDQGLVGMKVGGKRTLLIPAALAYGNRAVGGVIPADSDLMFQVELLKVQK